MIRVRVEGTEKEIVEFLEKMPEIPGFEKTHVREPKKETILNMIQVRMY